MTWTIHLTPTARQMLLDLKDRRIRDKVAERIDQLKEDPERQGKALTDELAGFRSVRAVGQRYRIIYRVARKQVIVVVVAAGIRTHGSKRDIYTLTKKLLKLGLLNP